MPATPETPAEQLLQRLRTQASALATAAPQVVLPDAWWQRVAAHGDLERWAQALLGVPPVAECRQHAADAVHIDGALMPEQRAQLMRCLRELQPWRKGPWRLFDIDIDTEWRSDWKWQRLQPALPDLCGARLLDVGCGNGYFGWRLLQAGAQTVVGVDPTVLFALQHQLINSYARSTRNWVLPLTFEEFPVCEFDGVLSLGVVYHRRDPLQHVRRLFACTRPGGWVVLESLIVNGDADLSPAPQARYARMRNVWCVPRPQTLLDWLQASGYEDARIVDMNRTSVAEQRTTDWMPFESLAEALHAEDSDSTVEGFPAPTRAIALARRPE